MAGASGSQGKTHSQCAQVRNCAPTSCVTGFAATRLRMELDRVPLWRGDHVTLKQLVDDFARYTYLPRLKNPAVLLAAIQDGLGLLLWQQDSFAYADSYDEASGRYRGLRCGRLVSISEANLSGMLVRPGNAGRTFFWIDPEG